MGRTQTRRRDARALQPASAHACDHWLRPRFQVPLADPTFSSLSAKPPVVMQRTYIFPKAVRALAATVTNQGISTKNLLAVLEGGQVTETRGRVAVMESGL